MGCTSVWNTIRRVLNYFRLRKLLDEVRVIENAYVMGYIDEITLRCLYVSFLEEIRLLGYGDKYNEVYFIGRLLKLKVNPYCKY